MIHQTSEVHAESIGRNTSIWQFCVVLRGAVIGDDCNICSHCFIENDVVIGNSVTIKNGVYLYDGIRIEDDVFIGPNVTFTNDVYPRSTRMDRPANLRFPVTRVCKFASIGGGATILPGVTIGEGAMIGAGAVVTKDVDPRSVVYGEQSKVRRKLDS